jgi:hypothetical protein
MAKMKMVFIGLDLGCAFLTYLITEHCYIREGGPSFTCVGFTAESQNETDGLTKMLEARAMTLVD